MPKIDRPMVQGDFAAQHTPLEALAKALRGLELKGLDDLGDELKGKVLTLLLRVGRQTKVQEDEEKEAARRGVMERLARVWLAVKDERRAGNALAAAGKEQAAAVLLKKSGDDESRIELFRTTGEFDRAAQILEKLGRHEEAAAAWREAGSLSNVVRVLHAAGDEPGIIETLKSLPGPEAEKLAVRYDVLDAWAKVLTERGDWKTLAKLYERHQKLDVAARAWEEAGEHAKAMKLFAKIGDAEGHKRNLEKVVEARLAKNDVLGAAKALANAGDPEAAADLAAEKHPDHAHRWYTEAGFPQKALELARREARKAEGHNDYELRAKWLERAGDLVSAATILEGLGKLERARRIYEEARAWEAAAKLAEELGDMEGAAELYYRAGLNDEAERVKLGLRKEDLEQAEAPSRPAGEARVAPRVKAEGGAP